VAGGRGGGRSAGERPDGQLSRTYVRTCKQSDASDNRLLDAIFSKEVQSDNPDCNIVGRCVQNLLKPCEPVNSLSFGS
jgi:hypothetical protein